MQGLGNQREDGRLVVAPKHEPSMAKPSNVIDDLLNNMFIGPFPSDGMGKERSIDTAIQKQNLNGVRTRVACRARSNDVVATADN